MIRDDIKSNLDINLLDSLFLQNRPGIDPYPYRVGEIKFLGESKVVVWNPKNNLIMDYFFDDSEKSWFSLNIIYPEIEDSDKYFINKLGEVKGYKGNILKIQKDYVWGYPQFKLKGKYKKLHITLCKLFIPNICPETNIQVDHKNRNREDYSLSNIRWVTIKENMNNRKTNEYNGRKLFRSYIDKNKTILDKEYSDEEIINEFGKDKRRRISDSVSLNYRVKNRYWDVIDLDLLDYLNSIGIKDINSIDNSLWKTHYSGEIKVHPLGLIKIGNKITCGGLSGDGIHKERRINMRKIKTKRVHVLVAEVFLNNNSPIKDGLVVDHIDTNSTNNRVDNLRICTQQDNMRNPITLEKLSKKVVGPDGTVYKSLTDCGKQLGVTPTTILNWIKYYPEKNFKYYNEIL